MSKRDRLKRLKRDVKGGNNTNITVSRGNSTRNGNHKSNNLIRTKKDSFSSRSQKTKRVTYKRKINLKRPKDPPFNEERNNPQKARIRKRSSSKLKGNVLKRELEATRKHLERQSNSIYSSSSSLSRNNTKKRKSYRTKSRKSKQKKTSTIGKVTNTNTLLKDPYIFSDSCINVMVCGKSRAGKSTLLKILMDPCHQPSKMSIFAQTERLDFVRFSLKHMDKDWKLNIIDTPGFEEHKENGDGERTNEQILSEIFQVLSKNKITHIDLILICINVVTGLTESAVQIAKKLFKGFENSKKTIKIGFVICRSEKLTKLEKNKLHSQFLQHKELNEFIKNGAVVLFSGAVDAEEERFSSQDLENAYKRVYLMRKKILELIFSLKTENRFNLSEINLFQKEEKDLLSLMSKLSFDFEKYENKKIDTEKTEEMRDNFRKVVKERYKIIAMKRTKEFLIKNFIKSIKNFRKQKSILKKIPTRETKIKILSENFYHAIGIYTPKFKKKQFVYSLKSMKDQIS